MATTRARTRAAVGGESSAGKTLTLTLRLPADLHAEVVRLAREQERSLNQQIVFMLRAGALT